MRYTELIKEGKTLGGFAVQPLDIEQSGSKDPVAEGFGEPSPVASAITRRIMGQRHDLLKYGPEAVMAAIDDVADWVGDVEEIGSSDVSGWVNQVERMLKENPPEAFGVGVDESVGPVTHRIGVTVTDPNHPMVSKRKETIQKSIRITQNVSNREAAINQAIAHYRRKGYKVHDHHYIGTVDDEPIAEEWSQKYKKSINCSHPKGFSQKAHCAGKKKHNKSIEMEMTCPDCGMCQSHGNLNEIKKGQKDSNGYTKCWPGKHAEGTKKGKNGGQVRNCVPNESLEVDEALKLDAPQQKWSRDELHSYVDRIQTDTKTKSDKFKPIIHGSNVKAIIQSDDPNNKWDLDDLARQITTRPSQILGTNAKMAKSKEEGAMTYDLTLPALSGIVVDEETGDFVEIKTCPGAGECQIFCYARKGGYRMFPASSMSAAQALNFLVNDPEGYMAMFDREVKAAQKRTDKAGIKLLVRIHDAGDFFSKDYYDLAMNVARNNPGAKFYFYTKMGDLAADAGAPPNVVGQFSSGSQNREVKKVEFQRGAGKHVKDAVTLPKDMFRELFVTDAKGKYVKDEKGRTQVKSEDDWNQFKQKLASAYKIDPDTIITYDQMLRIPEGPKPKWNVVVFPAGHGDLGASRLDVSRQFLMFH
jgi:hypothetical protein